MNAIKKLRRSGLSTADIADGITDKSGEHLVRMYERDLRFPGRKAFTCIVEIAEARGLTLLARDFLAATREAQCETETNAT